MNLTIAAVLIALAAPGAVLAAPKPLPTDTTRALRATCDGKPCTVVLHQIPPCVRAACATDAAGSQMSSPVTAEPPSLRLAADPRFRLNLDVEARLALPAPPCGTPEAATAQMCVKWTVRREMFINDWPGQIGIPVDPKEPK